MAQCPPSHERQENGCYVAKLILTIGLLVGNLPPLLGSADPAAQQLLVTAKRQASLFHDQARPIQLDVDFVAQMNVPGRGHLTEKWESKGSLVAQDYHGRFRANRNPKWR